jgi:hypothetical protein
MPHARLRTCVFSGHVATVATIFEMLPLLYAARSVTKRDQIFAELGENVMPFALSTR